LKKHNNNEIDYKYIIDCLCRKSISKPD